jgi:DNA-binding NtrC family response regulator
MQMAERPELGGSMAGSESEQIVDTHVAIRQLSVLVVEDDFGDYDAAARALKKMVQFEARPTRARTLEAARRALANQEFDIHLVDMNLGAESGARFLIESGGRSGRGVSIALTGLLTQEAHDLALRSGALACIAKKDLSPTLLETTIRSVLHTRRVEAEYQRLVQEMSSLVVTYRQEAARASTGRTDSLPH